MRMTAQRIFGIHCFLPSPRAQKSLKSSARTGKESINRKEINIYIICTYIFKKMNSFPRHLRIDASLSKMRGNEFTTPRIFTTGTGPQTRHVGPRSKSAAAVAQRTNHAQTVPNVDPAAQRFLPGHLYGRPRWEPSASVFFFPPIANVAPQGQENSTWK